MSHEEGVIKFKMEYQVAPALPAAALRELNAWRRILVLLEMIGQTPARYEGVASSLQVRRRAKSPTWLPSISWSYRRATPCRT